MGLRCISLPLSLQPVPFKYFLQLTWGFFFLPSGYFTDEFIHLFSGCFNVLYLFAGLSAQPILHFFPVFMLY